MTVNYVLLTVDEADGGGNPVSTGTATFTPSAALTDPADSMNVVAPVVATFRAGIFPVVKLLATDNSGPQPSGWAWTVTFSGVPGHPAGFSFFLPFASGSSQRLSAQTPVSSVTTMQAYMPLPSGTATAGYVPIATGSGEASAWGPQSGGGGFSNPMTTLGDTMYENATPAAARLAGNTTATKNFLTQTGTGSVSAAPAWGTIQAGDVPDLAYVDSVTAADASVVIGGAADTPTVRTGTLDVIAAQHPPAADWSNNSHKITSLANGTASSDAAAYGQTPAGGNTVTIGQGGTGQVTQQAALDALAGAVTASQVLAGNGTHVTLRALASGDIPDLAYVDTVSAGDSSVTVTGATDTPSVSSVPAQLVQRMHCV